MKTDMGASLLRGLLFALIALMVVIAVTVALWFATMPTNAQHLHDPQHPDHWYDLDCCDLRDCRPIDESEVRITPEGYVWTNETGSYVFPHDSTSLRWSRDGQYHGCEIKSTGRKLCLYRPPFGA